MTIVNIIKFIEMKTKQDVTIKYREFGEITVPKGTEVTNRTASGIDKNYHFVNEFEWITKNYPSIDKILKHEAVFYGINIPAEFIDYE